MIRWRFRRWSGTLPEDGRIPGRLTLEVSRLNGIAILYLHDGVTIDGRTDNLGGSLCPDEATP